MTTYQVEFKPKTPQPHIIPTAIPRLNVHNVTFVRRRPSPVCVFNRVVDY